MPLLLPFNQMLYACETNLCYIIYFQVRFSVFIYYFISCGIPFLFLLLFFLMCSEISLTGSRIWLAHWSSSNITESSEQNSYVGIYGALGIGQGFFLFLVAMTLAYICVNGSTVLNEKLLSNMLRLPLAFFETTPLGRIVNRFSKDIDVIDTMIPRNLSWFFQTSIAILGTVFLICYSTPLFMTVLLPLAVLYVLIQVSSRRPRTAFPTALTETQESLFVG